MHWRQIHVTLAARESRGRGYWPRVLFLHRQSETLQDVIEPSEHKVTCHNRRAVWTPSMVFQPTLNTWLTSYYTSTALRHDWHRHGTPTHYALECLLHVSHEVHQSLDDVQSLQGRFAAGSRSELEESESSAVRSMLAFPRLLE